MKGKKQYFSQIKGLVFYKLLNVFIRKLVHCQRLITDEFWKVFSLSPKNIEVLSKSSNCNHGHNILRLFVFDQDFLAPQVKRSMIY